MEIRLELNERAGRGFQVHLIHGPVDKLFDGDPLPLHEAVICALELLDAVNEAQGTDYTPNQVVRVPADALKGNAKTDFSAACLLQDIGTQRYELSTPAGQDVAEMVVDGERQPVISGRGVVLMAWAAWQEDCMPKAKDALRRYCEYISAHGHQGGASKAMAALIEMDMDHGDQWIKQTYARHVRDAVALMRYVLPEL